MSKYEEGKTAVVTHVADLLTWYGWNRENAIRSIGELISNHIPDQSAEIARLKRELADAQNLLRTSGGKTNG